MSHRIFSVASAIFLIASPALAGSFTTPTIEAAPVPQSALQQSSWTGTYIGASMGHAFNGEDRLGLRRPGGPMLTIETFQLGGPNLGLRAGYMTDLGGMIGGGEIGLTFGNISSRIDKTVKTGTLSAIANFKSQINHTLTLRGKLGSEVARDTLVYGIGGLSYGSFTYAIDVNGTAAGTAFKDHVSHNYNRLGYVIGLGIERRLTDRLSVTGEYEYANYGNGDLKIDVFTTRATPKFHNLSLGLNYRF